MILRNGNRYFIERIHENGLTITQINIDEGMKIIRILDPRIRQSSIQVEIKDKERIPFKYLFNFNLEEIAGMSLNDAKEYIWNKWESYR